MLILPRIRLIVAKLLELPMLQNEPTLKAFLGLSGTELFSNRVLLPRWVEGEAEVLWYGVREPRSSLPQQRAKSKEEVWVAQNYKLTKRLLSIWGGIPGRSITREPNVSFIYALRGCVDQASAKILLFPMWQFVSVLGQVWYFVQCSFRQGWQSSHWGRKKGLVTLFSTQQKRRGNVRYWVVMW